MFLQQKKTFANEGGQKPSGEAHLPGVERVSGSVGSVQLELTEDRAASMGHPAASMYLSK